MATPNPLPPITLSPASSSDFYAIAALETLTFYNEEFSAVAFGPKRNFPANLALREKILGSQPKEKGGANKVVKAVVSVDGKEEIVGAAGWTFVVGRDEKKMDGDGEGKVEVDGWKDEEGGNEDGAGRWGEGANIKLCEDVFSVADAHMLRSTDGKDYARLNTLVVSPNWQRRGIGKMLLENGLKETDELGLQAVLGASKEGKGLYKKYGFVEFEIMEIKLWEYDGAKGMGLDHHVIMRRPAQKR